MGKFNIPILLFLKVLFFLVGLSSYAQQLTLSGKVTDSLQNPLAYANILAMPETEEAAVQFAVTESNGTYKLGLSKNQNYKISISFMGYSTHETSLHSGENPIKKDFILQENPEQLRAVVLDYKPPIEVKKDTITYRVDAFTTGDERKLRETLKKLPGIEVDRLGNVYSQGKKITKVLVENRMFFTGDSKLAVNNIPADAVNEVEIIEDYNEVSMLKGLNDSEEIAMNIKLREDKKKFVFGDIELGAGVRKRYLAHPKLFYYSPKTNSNFIGDLNNQGTSSFGFKDYMDFEGGFGSILNNSNSSVTPFRSGLGQFINQQDAKSRTNRFAALNIRQSFSETTDLSGYIISSNTKAEIVQHTENEYLLEDAPYSESRDNTDKQDNFFTIGKLTLAYKPHLEEDFAYNSLIKITNSDSKALLNTINPFQDNYIATFREVRNLDLKQNISYSRKLSKNHTGTIEATYSFQNDKPLTEWKTDRPILQGLIPLEEDTLYHILQTKRNKTQQIDAALKHYWVFNNFNHLYTSVGVHAVFSEFYNQDEQLLSDGKTNNFQSAGFGNDFAYDFLNTFVGLEYKLRVGIATFKPMLYAHFYNWETIQYTEKNKQSKTLLLPQFTTKIEWNRSEKIYFKYGVHARFPDIEQLASNFVLSSFNSVYKGEDTLENQLYHSLHLNYTRFSMMRKINLHLSASLNKKVKQFKTSTQLDGIEQYHTSMMFDLPEYNWSLTGMLSKTIGKIQYKWRGNFNYNDFYQTLNNTTQLNISKSIASTASLETLFNKLPNIELGYTKDFNHYKSFGQRNNFENDRIFVNFRYRLLKNFIFNADYRWDQYQNKRNRSENHFDTANASLFYQVEDSPWGFEVQATNLFNTTFKQQNSFNSFLIRDSKTYILPRILMFKIAYKL